MSTRSATLSKQMQRKLLIATYSFLFVLACFLRFYELSEPDHPVFDEVYFPKFAYDYKLDKHFNHTHPPLARYVFFTGMNIYHALPWVDSEDFGKVEFDNLAPISYRWVNASLGLSLCALISLICWRLSRSHLFTLLALAFVATDGALVVASRFGLSNAHITFWGFLSLCFFVRALQEKLPNKFLVISAACLGCVITVKWNGLLYLVSVLAVLLGVFLSFRVFKLISQSHTDLLSTSFWPEKAFSNFNIKKAAVLVVIMLALPALIYRVLWVPDRLHNDNVSFTQIHQSNWGYHSSAEVVGDHPYCSAWYTWPIMKRPIGYDFENNKREVNGQTKKFYKDIHSFGNPILYWFSSVAIAIVILWFFVDCAFGILKKPVQRDFYIRALISVGYLGSWLPWAFVTRCTFLYHYQTASIFSFLALAWLLTRLNAFHKFGKYPVIIFFGLVVASFIYFLPFILGIELESSKFYDRMWFQSWI